MRRYYTGEKSVLTSRNAFRLVLVLWHASVRSEHGDIVVIVGDPSKDLCNLVQPNSSLCDVCDLTFDFMFLTFHILFLKLCST